jgi:hypothetical protein
VYRNICYPPLHRASSRIHCLRNLAFLDSLPLASLTFQITKLLCFSCLVAAEWLLEILRTHVRCWTPCALNQHITAGYLTSEHIQNIYHHEPYTYVNALYTTTTFQDQLQPQGLQNISTHHPSTVQHQSNNVYPSRRALCSLSLPLPQTLTRPMCRLWLSKSRHHRKGSLCWIQVPDAYHRTEIDTSTNAGWQYQDAEPLKPFPIPKLTASQASYTSDACNIHDHVLASCINRHTTQPYGEGTKHDHLT